MTNLDKLIRKKISEYKPKNGLDHIATFFISLSSIKHENVTGHVERIKSYVDRFINHVKKNPTKIYYVTPIGCGLAGHHVRDVAPLFQDCIDLKNVYLPKVFWRILIKF